MRGVCDAQGGHGICSYVVCAEIFLRINVCARVGCLESVGHVGGGVSLFLVFRRTSWLISTHIKGKGVVEFGFHSLVSHLVDTVNVPCELFIFAMSCFF